MDGNVGGSMGFSCKALRFVKFVDVFCKLFAEFCCMLDGFRESLAEFYVSCCSAFVFLV